MYTQHQQAAKKESQEYEKKKRNRTTHHPTEDWCEFTCDAGASTGATKGGGFGLG